MKNNDPTNKQPKAILSKKYPRAIVPEITKKRKPTNNNPPIKIIFIMRLTERVICSKILSL